MYLRTINLAGFKSFADRTRLTFEPGVGVVVGPNGSGKSNLVDAVAWVMGTQSTRALRTHKMEDLIFAGTATRPALGRAEVGLVFDNADRALPLDLEEVSITRRTYRDGTSEYLINGAECRLADIQELLADSGVGRHQHTIVGQGQIDAILNASTDEHRAVIEEAAGVLKHRLRKERAIRRLERTDTDLVRLRDIERELERQIRPLRRQVKAAERYEEVRGRVRALRLYLDGLELTRVGDRLAEGRLEADEVEAEVEKASRRLQQLSNELADADRQIEAGRAGLERDAAAAGRLETAVERFERIAQVARERLRTASSKAEHEGERRADLVAERADVEHSLGLDREQREALQLRFQALTAGVGELAEAERSLAEQARLPAEGVVAMLRGELSSLERAEERDHDEQAQVMGRMAVLTDHLQADTAVRDQVEGEIRLLDESTTAATATYSEALRARQVDQGLWEAAEEAASKAHLEAASARAALGALVASALGAPGGVSTAAALEVPGVSIELKRAFECPPDLYPALRAVLGRWLDAVVLDAEADLAAAVNRLAGGEGRGVPVVRDNPSFLRPSSIEVARTWGVDAMVDRLGLDPSASAAALVSDVVVVESWGVGLEIVSRHPEVRAVTPEGDLVTAFGIALHDPERDEAAMVGSARAALEEAERELARRESLLATAKRSFERLREAERESLEQLEKTEAGLAGAADALDRADRERSAVEEELGRLQRRLASLEEAEAARVARIQGLRTRLSEAQEAGADQDEQQLVERRREVETQRRIAEGARDGAAAELAAVGERIRLLEHRRVSIDAELDHLGEGDRRQGRQPLTSVEATAQASLDLVRKHLHALRERQRHQREALDEALTRQKTVRAEEARLRSAIEGARERAAQLAVELTELRLRVEAVSEGLRRDLDAPPEEALAAPMPPLDAEGSPHARLEALEVELRRMGPVNPLAGEEYREISKRLAFLRGQLNDVDSSRAKLHRLVSTLDDRIAQEFRAAFDQVSSHFERHFEILFPGGHGRVRLTDPDHMLESGVEILAQPIGKRVSRLSLLSGGERSLAALAFLFSVFRARPSPFYMLDEVEAALDDANLRRFLLLVDEFRSEAQLIIVTHQQQTMGAADVLYGVTLEAGGSTQVVAKRLVSTGV